ncbi:MAG: tRNA pseudouridine(55) synthase TruB [Candidatus Omnitrophica bacterium]|nr:tRNA pseudouridine(55) synthase TruB [Candidatus Omnitrophota bacterium]MCM8790866.1 tRNA pseudouridine(55) synthase TruB [Candidatus Omnitrophota bacterium]
MDGILIVNKPQGMTSHDVVDFMRRRFGFKKVGHAGTLDPMATGVLVMLIGKSTKHSNSLSNEEKEYEATMTLGARSDTGDAWGKLEPSGKLPDLRREDIEKVFAKFTGDIEQVPPMYSAIKMNGKKLYELARKGLSANPKARKIRIKELVITRIAMPEISFRVVCSKGTYVRQLCVDIGEEFGCGAYLSKLTRTRSGNCRIEESISMDELKGADIVFLGKKLFMS